MTVTVYRRTINGKKGEWELDSIYTDNIKNERSSNDYCVEQTEIVLSNVNHVRCKRFEHDLNQEENEEEQVNLY